MEPGRLFLGMLKLRAVSALIYRANAIMPSRWQVPKSLWKSQLG